LRPQLVGKFLFELFVVGELVAGGFAMNEFHRIVAGGVVPGLR
jgi:hypothetical protein